MNNELKPCPMCASPAVFVRHSAGLPGTIGYDSWHGISCKSCGVSIGTSDRRFRVKSDAASAWNCRATASTAQETGRGG